MRVFTVKIQLRIQVMRTETDKSIRINCAYDLEGHSRGSRHALGLAADIVIRGLSLQEQFEAAWKSGFRGIGVYPDWITPGIHVDVRQIEPKVSAVLCNTWAGRSVPNQPRYVALNMFCKPLPRLNFDNWLDGDAAFILACELGLSSIGG